MGDGVLPNTGVAILAKCRFGNTGNTNETSEGLQEQTSGQWMFVVAAAFNECGMRTISYV